MWVQQGRKEPFRACMLPSTKVLIASGNLLEGTLPSSVGSGLGALLLSEAVGRSRGVHLESSKGQVGCGRVGLPFWRKMELTLCYVGRNFG